MLNRKDVINELNIVINDIIECDIRGITPTSAIFEDFDMDSLDKLDIASQLEDIYDIQIDIETALAWTTVAQIIDFVLKEVSDSKKVEKSDLKAKNGESAVR